MSPPSRPGLRLAGALLALVLGAVAAWVVLGSLKGIF